MSSEPREILVQQSWYEAETSVFFFKFPQVSQTCDLFKLFGVHRRLPCSMKDHDEDRLWSHTGDVTKLLIKDGVPTAPL